MRLRFKDVTLLRLPYATFPIGFTFDFYGVSYTDFFVSSNGFLAISGASNGCCSGQNLPNPTAPNGVIAGWWEDMNPSGGGRTSTGAGERAEPAADLQLTSVQHWRRNPVTRSLLEGTNIIEALPGGAVGRGHTAGLENQTDGGARPLRHAL
jgi:hypothetical protein